MSILKAARGATAAEIETRRAAGEFVALAKYLALAGEGGLPAALQLATEHRAVDRIREILKSAIAIGRTDDVGWAGSLTSYTAIAEGFLETTRSVSAIQQILSDNAFRPVPFAATTGRVTVGVVAATVGEGLAKPISRLSLELNLPADPMKIVCTIVISSALLRFGTGTNQLLAAELTSAVGVETDRAVLAELITTSTPSQPSAGDTASAAIEDLAFLLGSVRLTATSRPYFIGGADAVLSLSLREASSGRFDELGPTGGMLASVPVLVSDGVSPNDLVLVDANKVVVASNTITLDVARHANVIMDDAPSPPGTPVSLWQQNAVGIRAERYIQARALSPDALAVVTGVGGSA